MVTFFAAIALQYLSRLARSMSKKKEIDKFIERKEHIRIYSSLVLLQLWLCDAK